jgi:RecA/RadA recombinase
MAVNSLVKQLIKESNNDMASAVSSGILGDCNTFLDTGSFSLNALLSGSMYGGVPSNKITCLAGSESVGKTFFALSIAKNFLDTNKDSIILYFESEGALTTDMITDRDIDTDRFAIFPVATVEEFRTQCVKVIEGIPKETKVMIFLDSLGNLSTLKEMGDVASGSDKRDMTRAPVIRGTFRTLALKLSVKNIPLIITNHTYDKVGSMFPSKEISGGGGIKYAASVIVTLGKRKVKDGTEVMGNIIKCKLVKGRFTKEESVIETMLDYQTGLDKYFGLVAIAEKYNIFKKVSTRFEMPDGSKAFEKTIVNNPEKYFTEDIMKQLEKAVFEEFNYGSRKEEKNEVNEE